MSMGRHRADVRTRRRESGFTLMELLVAITLLGLLLAAAFGGLRFGSRAWEAGDRRAEALSEIASVQRFLRSQLSAALIPSEIVEDEGGAFQGTSAAIRFAAPASRYLGAAGPQATTVAVVSAEDGKRLVVGRRPLVGDGGDAGDGPSGTVLLDRIAGAAIDYYGAADENDEPEWRAEWDQDGALPRLIRIRVRFPDGDARRWPELVVAPMVNARNDSF